MSIINIQGGEPTRPDHLDLMLTPFPAGGNTRVAAPQSQNLLPGTDAHDDNVKVDHGGRGYAFAIFPPFRLTRDGLGGPEPATQAYRVYATRSPWVHHSCRSL